MMDRAQWIKTFAAELGVPSPSEDEVEFVLALAGEAAHASERSAAPLACWVAAQAGFSAREALEAARMVPGGAPGER